MSSVNDGRRSAQARATRDLIVDTASALFHAHGYPATSLTAIAAGAGVVVQTIYNAVGNKAAVLNAVLDRTVSGPNAPMAVPDFMRERMAAAGDSASAVAVLADWLAEVNPRAEKVFELIRQAAAVDPEIAELERRRDAACETLGPRMTTCALEDAKADLAAGMRRVERVVLPSPRTGWPRRAVGHGADLPQR